MKKNESADQKRPAPSPGSTRTRRERALLSGTGQPAFGAYLVASAGIRRRAGLLVPTFSGDRICAITRFDSSVLPWFGLPPSLPG